MLIRNIKNLIRNRAWIFLKANWTLRSGITLKITNDSDWFVFNEIFTNKEYDPVFVLFLQSVSDRPLILDLGANVGYFTLKVADELIQASFKQFDIIALEASLINFEVLQNRVAQPLLNGKVKPLVGLAGHKTGFDSIIYSQQHYGNSITGKGKSTNSTKVHYVNIETILKDANRPVDLLKCDIEGSEEIFISTYTELLKRTNTAVFEFHGGECDIENCRRLLLQSGLLSKGIIKEEAVFKTTVEMFSRL